MGLMFVYIGNAIALFDCDALILHASNLPFTSNSLHRLWICIKYTLYQPENFLLH